MALIKCYECSAEISDNAICCPHCGAPIAVPKVESSETQQDNPLESTSDCKNSDLKTNTDIAKNEIASDYTMRDIKRQKAKRRSKSKAAKIISALIVISIIAVAVFVCKFFNDNTNENNESKAVDMGAVGNKITVNSTIAYVADENKILVPYDFHGSYDECQSTAHTKNLKGCESPQLPTDETENLPEEVVREIISYYGEGCGFWTSLEASHQSIEFSDAEPESLHYAGIMDSYFSTKDGETASLVYGYCLSAVEDKTDMGLLVCYNIIPDEFEFTDVEDTADPNYNTVPNDLYESVMGTNDDDSDTPQQNTSTQQSDDQENTEDVVFDVDAKILDDGELAISNGWVYFRGSLGLCRMKTDGSNKQSIVKGNPLRIEVKDDWIYYCDDNTALYRIKIDGSNKQILYEGDVGDFIIDQDWIYCCSGFDSEVFRIKIDGSNKQKITSWLSSNLTIAENWLYLDDLYRIKKDGTDLQEIDTSTTHDNIKIIDDWIFYSSHSLGCIKTDGSQNRQICEDDTYQFVIMDDWIYYSNISDDNKIYRIKTNGTERQLFLDEAVNDLWTDGDWIFYTTSVVGDLLRIKADGSHEQFICQSY